MSNAPSPRVVDRFFSARVLFKRSNVRFPSYQAFSYLMSRRGEK